MKKRLAFIMAAILTVCAFTGCGNNAATQGNTTESTLSKMDSEAAEEEASVEAVASGDKISIVTTIFPEYDWVKNIVGDASDKAEITMLLDNGVDLHSYQPTADDIMKIVSCDMFIYVGGESDEWVDDALKEATNKDMVVINLLDVLGGNVKEEEVVEGMEAEEEEEGEEGEEGEEEEVEYDEHVWLSLTNASIICDAIADGLSKVDADNAATYTENANAYKQKLNNLDGEYKSVTSAAANKTLLFGDRFPFRYLVDDYGLDYYAAFVGCSAETEASFETIAFLAGKVDELGLKSIMTIEGPDKKIAETIKNNTKSKDQNILTLDSMQSTTSEDVANGTTYLSVMQANLEVLKEALQ
ncbi:zinc ABC transporter substrate-binding protein [Butyrivibrio sp. X503]|uniref:metal ABC transporter substrate-binding protein n=1 Tax=Butyrivibrio sp. X503 TaxID=2364878 RepID=UPI000EAACC4C|nr:metal ABC transporter substrate-binding protein [Butyrivibrio sp. X503]RKM54072.1 zinc ABC transporter substrate-binding protein [Butyrivibrio sp. X503]